MKNIEDVTTEVIDAFHLQIGRNVKKLREQKGYSQLALAQALGHKSVGLISQGELYLKKQHFNLEHLYKIAYILECDIKDLTQLSHIKPNSFFV